MTRTVMICFLPLCVCIPTIISVTIPLNTTELAVDTTDMNLYGLESKSLPDLPLKKDLFDYMKSLNKILRFSNKNRFRIDEHLIFGLSLTYDNLRSIHRTKVKLLRKNLRIYLKKMMWTAGDIISHFFSAVNRSETVSNVTSQKISLISNRLFWARSIHSFDVPQQNDFVGIEEFKKIYTDWRKYSLNVNHLYSWKPTPKDSDDCLVSLASNGEGVSNCTLKESCYDMLKYGTDFGYALTKRLLWILLAKHGRGCRIFSSEGDKSLADSLCEKAFNEATYIATNEYKHLGLMLEEMCYCALAGHTEMLRRSWLSDILRYQMPYGCFGSVPYRKASVDNICSNTVTAAAAGTLAMASRFIVEMYYY